MAPGPVSTACFMNLFCQFVCLYLYSRIVAEQLLSKHVTVETNKHATVEELFERVFYVVRVV
jgi:hypothetical protein